jgi:hypothetical protein
MIVVMKAEFAQSYIAQARSSGLLSPNRSARDGLGVWSVIGWLAVGSLERQ